MQDIALLLEIFKQILITKAKPMEEFDDGFGDLSGHKILSFDETSSIFKENKNNYRQYQIAHSKKYPSRKNLVWKINVMKRN